MSAADVIGQKYSAGSLPKRAIIKWPSRHQRRARVHLHKAGRRQAPSGMGTSVADALLAHYGVDAVITDEDHATATGSPPA